MGESSEEHLNDAEAGGTAEEAQDELKTESAGQIQRESKATDETKADEVEDRQHRRPQQHDKREGVRLAEEHEP